MIDENIQQVKSLSDSLDQMKEDLALIQTRLNFVQYQLKLGHDQNDKLKKLLFRWRVELAQSECRIIKVKEEVYNRNNNVELKITG
jgi:hypothetical protein